MTARSRISASTPATPTPGRPDLGAVQVDDRRRPDGSGRVVLADPEGDEFCILRGASRPAT